MNADAYYLSSLDSERLAPTRVCTFLKPLRFDTGKECALARLSPPVIGQPFGLGEDIDVVAIANRHEGEGLFPILTFPCFVFVARSLIDDIEDRSVISSTDVEVIGWGELYRTKHDADNHVFEESK